MGHESGMLIALPAFALPITRQRWDGFKSLHLTMAHSPSAASWVPSNLAGAMPRAHRADAWQRCADDPATLLLLIACWMGQGLLVLRNGA
jgi:hypothetical protein